LAAPLPARHVSLLDVLPGGKFQRACRATFRSVAGSRSQTGDPHQQAEEVEQCQSFNKRPVCELEDGKGGPSRTTWS